MPHYAGPATTAVTVVASGALRRAAWSALLDAQPGIDVVETVPVEAGPGTGMHLSGQGAVLVDGQGVDRAGAGALAAAFGGAGVLWLVDELAVPAVVELLRAGVTGCLPMEASTVELARALVAVGRGELALPASVAAAALGAMAKPRGNGHEAAEALSLREREVVGFLVEGKTNKEIAQGMFLSVRTVEAYLRSIYMKIEVRSRTEAVLWAIAHQEVGGR
jgi:DNA-binding NarL/FixJ family response regulator